MTQNLKLKRFGKIARVVRVNRGGRGEEEEKTADGGAEGKFSKGQKTSFVNLGSEN